jgi:hypothetical protein
VANRSDSYPTTAEAFDAGYLAALRDIATALDGRPVNRTGTVVLNALSHSGIEIDIDAAAREWSVPNKTAVTVNGWTHDPSQQAWTAKTGPTTWAVVPGDPDCPPSFPPEPSEEGR